MSGDIQQGMALAVVYVRDDVSATLLRYTGRLIEEAPESWSWGVQSKDKKHLSDLLPPFKL